MYTLKIIIASTRPGRKGPALANWIHDIAGQRENFKVELVDLEKVNLPFLDEPKHPRFKDYSKDHTKQWSQTIDEADAFIIVTPEYNYGYPAPLKNALDFLYQEWNRKPVGFVSYGGVAGGTRSVQQLTQVVTILKMIPIMSAVNVPFFTKFIDDSGKFNAEEGIIKAANGMLDEIFTWAEKLKPMRK